MNGMGCSRHVHACSGDMYITILYPRFVHPARYLDPLEVERVELHSFASKAMVTSFRTLKLEGWVVDELERIAAAKAKGAELVQDEMDADDQDLIKAHTMGEQARGEDMQACCFTRVGPRYSVRAIP